MKPHNGTLEHTADLGIWVEAMSLEELFERAAHVLAALMYKGHLSGELQWHPMHLEAADGIELMVAYLNEIIYLIDGEEMLTVAVKIKSVDLAPSGAQLDARLGLLPYDSAQHQILSSIKAATFHQAVLEPQGDGWRSEIFLDV